MTRFAWTSIKYELSDRFGIILFAESSIVLARLFSEAFWALDRKGCMMTWSICLFGKVDRHLLVYLFKA